MKSAVIVFPASNCDRDAAVALEQATGTKPLMLWHGDSQIPAVDLIVLPGGFSYGDYLRAGAMASRSPIMDAVIAKAQAGVKVLGICNGFQILTEAGLLPGALMRNAGLDFVCGTQSLQVANENTPFTKGISDRPYVEFPVAHHDGNFRAEEDVLDRLEGEGQVVFRYVTNPNGSARNIAGIVNDKGNVLGMMPHPERAVSPLLGGTDGSDMFKGLIQSL